MQALTPSAEQTVQSLAQRYGVSADAVKTLLFAVSAGGGTMAQFYHSELGGSGQWMRGGMTMVGDMFNYGLQSTVSGLCTELSDLLGSQPVFAAPPAGAVSGGSAGAWWPSELGQPSASGGQNDGGYAYFPQARRLAIRRNGQVTLYDTLDHQIGGVQQQQGGSYGALSFSSQYGTFSVDSLPLAPQTGVSQMLPPAYEQVYQAPAPAAAGGASPQSQAEIMDTLERLGNLYQKGILSEAEFQAKKAELLARL